MTVQMIWFALSKSRASALLYKDLPYLKHLQIAALVVLLRRHDTPSLLANAHTHPSAEKQALLEDLSLTCIV